LFGSEVEGEYGELAGGKKTGPDVGSVVEERERKMKRENQDGLGAGGAW